MNICFLNSCSFESKPGINYNVNNLSQQSINKIDKKLMKHLQGNLRKYLSEQNLENREYIFND